MLDLIYYWAAQADPYAQWAIVLAVGAGVLANHGGTRRIGLVVGGVTLFFMAASQVPDWPNQRMIWLTAVNLLAAVPLLIHPVTSRQQGIAATFLGLGVMHCAFAIWGTADVDVLKVNWLLSRLIDVIQAGLLMWWSWPHARERINGGLHQGFARGSGRHNAVASVPPAVRETR